MMNDWAFAGGRSAGAAVLAALVERGLAPGFVVPVDPAERDRLAALAPDSTLVSSVDGLEVRGILTCRYGLLPPERFRSLKLGAFNLHASLLPAYRGVHPISWAIVDGERETGVTLHRIDESIDTGPIALQASTLIEDNDDLHSVTARLDGLTASLAVVFLSHVRDRGEPPPMRVQPPGGSYARRRTPEDGRFDGTFTAERIRNLVRALPLPMPPAYLCDVSGRRFHVARVSAGPSETALAFRARDQIIWLEGKWV